MEDRIRILCTELLVTKDEEKTGPIIVELRDALHQHIERLRAKVAQYPMVIERRKHPVHVTPFPSNGRELLGK